MYLIRELLFKEDTTIRLEEMRLNLEKKYKVIDKENSLF
jgi:hypothetical protein